MWSHDLEDEDDARGLRKEDVDATTPRMSLRQRRRRSRHRALLFLGTCVALAVAFAMLRSGVREQRGARDRVDGGVDGDYEAHAGEPFEESSLVRKTHDGDLPGADQDSTEEVPAGIAGRAEDEDESAGSATKNEAIRKSMRRGAVVKQHRRAGDTNDEEALRDETRTARTESSSQSSSGDVIGRLFRFFGGVDTSADESSSESFVRQNRRRVARLHVTRDPSTGHLTMNDVGSGAFAVSQPKSCAPIASEADGEENSVAGAMLHLRTAFRVGKILRRCDAVSLSAFGTERNSADLGRGTVNLAESLLYDLNAATTYGALCYTPDFLRGVASTLSVCSRNHEDGVALALFGFAGLQDYSRRSEALGKQNQNERRVKRDRVLVSVSDASPNAPERGASHYLVHNHRFKGAFIDALETSAEAKSAHFRDRNVPNNVDSLNAHTSIDFVSGAAACVTGRLEPKTIGAEIRKALEVLEGASEDGAGKDAPSIEAALTDDADDAKRTLDETRSKQKTRRVEIDLLTLDVARDGLYLVQPALETVSPRVVAASYDSAFGPERALAVKPGFSGVRSAFEEDDAAEAAEAAETTRASSSRASSRREGSAFVDPRRPGKEEEEEENALAVSASLSAYLRVLERWGFHFVGCEAAGETAFFLRSDVIEAAHKAGRGSVHVTTPEDSGCFSARAPRMAMKKWPRIEARNARKETLLEVNEAWLKAHAPGPPWRADDAFLSFGAEEL